MIVIVFSENQTRIDLRSQLTVKDDRRLDR